MRDKPPTDPAENPNHYYNQPFVLQKMNALSVNEAKFKDYQMRLNELLCSNKA